MKRLGLQQRQNSDGNMCGKWCGTTQSTIYCGTASGSQTCEQLCANVKCPTSATRNATGGAVSFRKDRIGGTGQPVTWRKQSGDSGGKILGLTTQQALIAVGVGVAAYFIIKKVK